MTLDTLLKTALLSLRHPRAALQVVLSWNLSLSESALALTLMAVLSAALGSLVIQMPPGIDPISSAMLSNPLYLAVVQLTGLVLISVCIHLLGRVARGHGTLPQAMAMMAWAEALWIAISVVEGLSVIVLPPLGLLLIPVGTVLSLWLLINFTAALHGFASLFLTLLGVIAAFVAAMIAAVFLLMVLLVVGVLHV